MTTEKKVSRRKRFEAPTVPTIDGLTWASEMKPGRLSWAWPGYLPSGAITMIEGRKCTGKSSLATALAAAMSGGPGPPGWKGPRPRRVVWVAGEDAWETVVLPRLVAAGCDLRMIGKWEVRTPAGGMRIPQLPYDLEQLRHVLFGGDVGLLVLDPFVSLAQQGLDMRIEKDVRSMLEPLGQLLAEADCVGLLSRHLRKGNGGDTRDQGLGSVGLGNVARHLLRTDEHPHHRKLNCLSIVATNFGPKAPTLNYRIVNGSGDYPRIEWDGVDALDADQIAEGRGTAAERDEWTDAERLLALCIGGEWITVAVIEDEGRAAGISERTLRRAKANLGCPSRRVQRGTTACWEWGPPPTGWPAGLATTGPEGG